MTLNVPASSLVLLIGSSGSGKTTFGRTHFAPYEVVSSDECRGMVSNDVNSLKASPEAFELLNKIVALRLKKNLLTVIDATNVQASSRKSLIQLAREYHVLPVAIVLNLPQKVCEARNETREDRNFGNHVIRKQQLELKRGIRKLKREGFRRIHVLNSEEEVAEVTGITRDKLYNDRREVTGPFDIIGDIHGCYDELRSLLSKLGYCYFEVQKTSTNQGVSITHPEGRKVLFLGDLTDRGPKSPEVLKLVMSMVNAGDALCVAGNHDAKLAKKLSGKDVNLKHGLAETMEQLANEPADFIPTVRDFLYGLISHFVLDNGKLVIAHAGIREEMQGRGSGAVRAFCMYGETTGEIDEFGLPVRHDWAAEYRGDAKVVYGHTPIPEAEWFNNTINIDTGCVFGGELTALRYPENELVAVRAKEMYYEPAKPLVAIERKNAGNFNVAKGLNQQQSHDDTLHIEDVIGKRIIQTRLRSNLTIREENSIAALEVMSRFAVNPKWLIYLPPTMSPCATSELPEFLEHPAEAIEYYRKRGVKQIVCEEKHMGSRAVIVVCKDELVAEKRFGVTGEGIGVCYTRTGRNFFNDETLAKSFLKRVREALTKAGTWEKFSTDWICLDAELMPWSAKAQSLLKDQYAAVAAAAEPALTAVNEALVKAATRNVEGLDNVLAKFTHKRESIDKFRTAYRHYCWPVTSLADYKLAPFHILATEGEVHADKDHQWHMDNIHAVCDADEQLFRKTPYHVIDTESKESRQSAIDWWLELTRAGGEGMVVKPLDFTAFGKGGLLQPAVKCRGSEYLRIIYGPEYDAADNLKLLKKRGLSRKRSLALREFALGIEALERFVRQEPLRRIHESVFGVLALESEEVDPRL